MVADIQPVLPTTSKRPGHLSVLQFCSSRRRGEHAVLPSGGLQAPVNSSFKNFSANLKTLGKLWASGPLEAPGLESFPPVHVSQTTLNSRGETQGRAEGPRGRTRQWWGLPLLDLAGTRMSKLSLLKTTPTYLTLSRPSPAPTPPKPSPASSRA